MNVVAVVPAYPPAARIGAFLATHRYLAHAASHGHRVDVLVPRHISPYILDGVRVWSSSKGRTAPAEVLPDADVVATHCGDGGMGDRTASEVDAPLVKFAHGGKPDTTGADLVVWNSESLRDGRPGIVCRPQVDLDAHRVAQTGGHVTIINLTRPKGVVTADAVARRLPGRRWLAVRGGYGHQEPPRGPYWTVWAPQRDMRTVWAETRILLMPSEYETWGMVAIEAAASGIPTIAHPTPGLRESLGPAGIFVDRDDTDAWVAAIEALDDPATYTAASTAARARSDELAAAVPGDLERFRFALEELCAS